MTIETKNDIVEVLNKLAHLGIISIQTRNEITDFLKLVCNECLRDLAFTVNLVFDETVTAHLAFLHTEVDQK